MPENAIIKELGMRSVPHVPGHSIFVLGDHVFSKSNTLSTESLISISEIAKSQRMGHLRHWGAMPFPVCQMSSLFLSPFYFYYFKNSSLSITEEFPRVLQQQCWQATAFPSRVDSHFCEVRTASGSTYQGTGWWKRRQKVLLSRGWGPWTLAKGNRMESVYILLWVLTIFSPFSLNG